MIPSFAARQMSPRVRRGALRWSRNGAILVGIAALATAVSLSVSFQFGDAMPADCGTTGRERCHLQNVPPRVGSEAIRIPGKPHLYSKLITPVSFTDAAGAVWTAPRATLTDGASIPPVFVPLIGAPRSPEFLAAAALHDAYCGAGNENLPQFRARGWEETHRMFYHSLRAAGVPAGKAKVMFAAVYLGGPRWNDAARSLDGVADEVLRAEMERCIRFIEEEEPDLGQIEAWMRRREARLLASRGTVD